jgi:hypothetical protein
VTGGYARAAPFGEVALFQHAVSLPEPYLSVGDAQRRKV